MINILFKFNTEQHKLNLTSNFVCCLLFNTMILCWSTKDIDVHSIMSIKNSLQYKSIDNYVATINIIMGESRDDYASCRKHNPNGT